MNPPGANTPAVCQRAAAWARPAAAATSNTCGTGFPARPPPTAGHRRASRAAATGSSAAPTTSAVPARLREPAHRPEHLHDVRRTEHGLLPGQHLPERRPCVAGGGDAGSRAWRAAARPALLHRRRGGTKPATQASLHQSAGRKRRGVCPVRGAPASLLRCRHRRERHVRHRPLLRERPEHGRHLHHAVNAGRRRRCAPTKSAASTVAPRA